jgi:uncharacterized protein YndB with AHSA1/START domain
MSQDPDTGLEPSTVQSTFTIERIYDAPPERVFEAWAEHAAKSRWFGPPGEKADYSLDFRVGGLEHLTVPMPDGEPYAYDARYQDIVPGRRIIYSYDMHHGRRRISVSLAVVELAPHGTGTRLLLSEHGAYLDGQDTSAAREHGTNALMDALGAALGGPSDA